jgi:hypothetical protein
MEASKSFHRPGSIDCSNDAFFFLLLEIPPVCAPDSVNFPAEPFQNSLPSSVARDYAFDVGK